jgi:hypothetical protein
LLRALLPDSAPPDLSALADISHPKVSKFRPNEFVSALTFFCRPDDVAELRELAARAAEARATNERAAALQALAERARHAAPAASDTPATTRKPFTTRHLAAAAVVALLLICGAGAAWTLTRPRADGGGAGGDASALERVASRVQQSVTTAAAFVQETLETPPAPVAGRGADLTLPARRATRRGTTIGPTRDAVAEAPVPETPAIAVGAPAADPPSEAPATAAGPAVDAVFSASNADVVPPTLARPQMPEAQIGGLPTGRPGVLELVVGRDGQVMTARLVPASSRHQDRMMVSAAKAWRFSPALRNGEAVAYRLHMPITW